MLRSCAVFGLVALAVACQREAPAEPAASPARDALGTERNDCRPDRSCDPGLVCLSNLCVRPPPADCQLVGEIFASYDLGNYAERETRAPVIAKYKALCEKTYVTREQGECLSAAKDRGSAERCVPAMFPEQPAGIARGDADCAKIAAKVKGLITNQQPALQNDPQMHRWLQVVVDMMKESCEQDGWPAGLKRCALAATPQDLMGQACKPQMPPGLQQKLEARLTRAMQQMQPTQPATP